MQKTAIDFKNFIFILIVIAVLLLLDSQNHLQGPKNAVLNLLSPVQDRLQISSNKLNDFLYTFEQIDKFKEENERLNKENQSLNYELVQMEELKKENELLKKQLKFKENLCGDADCLDFEMGRVISRSSDSYEELIMINLGSKNGAKVNQAVTSDGGVMVGKITEVFDNYSKVMLLVSPESSVNCLAQTTRANGLVRGQYGTGVKLEKIGQSEELIQGDIIITSGLEAEIPKGLILGKISVIEEAPNMVFKSADIDIFADFSHLEEVFLVKQNGG